MTSFYLEALNWRSWSEMEEGTGAWGWVGWYGGFMMDLDARKLDFGACEQQRRRPASTSMQPDQRFCYLLSGKYISQTCSMQNFNILTSLCS